MAKREATVLALTVAIALLIGCVETRPTGGRRTGRGSRRRLLCGGQGCGSGVPTAAPPAPPPDCTPCGEGEYQVQACTGTDDRVCAPCSSLSSCGSGQYRSGCGGSSAGSCVACTVGTFKTSSGSEACSSCAGCSAGKYRSGCGGSSAGSCIACGSGTFKTSSGSEACSSCAGCGPGEFLTQCTATSDSRCQSCSDCGIGESTKAVCTQQSDTVCVACNASSIPSNSEFTTAGSCAWRCKSGFSLDANSKCAEKSVAMASPLPKDVPVPSLAVELQLSVTKSKFLLQQDVFIRGIAMQAGVNPIDVQVVTVTETNAPGTRADASRRRRRRRAELRVVTQIRTTDPGRVQGTLTLSAVNTALEQAGLPPAEWMEVKIMPAGKMASASAPPGTENIADQPEGNRRLVVIALSAAAGALALLISMMLVYRRCKSPSEHEARRVACMSVYETRRGASLVGPDKPITNPAVPATSVSCGATPGRVTSPPDADSHGSAWAQRKQSSIVKATKSSVLQGDRLSSGVLVERDPLPLWDPRARRSGSKAAALGFVSPAAKAKRLQAV